MPEKTTSFKNANIGLTSGWSQGELLWGSPLNDDLMMLDTLCQARVNKIITSKNQQPVSINKGDAYIYAIEPLDINLIGPPVAKNDIVIFRSGSINDYIAVTPKHGWKVFNKDDSSTYVYTKDDNKNILIWEKESVIKKYNSFVELPSIGNPKILYIVDENSTIYFWNSKQLKYEKMISLIPKIDVIDCGDSTK